jgi:hypothetical protein
MGLIRPASERPFPPGRSRLLVGEQRTSFAATIARGMRSVIDGGQRYFGVSASLSILTSLSISRQVSNST